MSEEYTAFFQAIGVIEGECRFSKEGNFIKIAGKDYRLFWIPQKKKAFEALQKEVESSGSALQRLVVYPKVIHFPERDKDHIINFQVVGFAGNKKDVNPQSPTNELKPGEFKLSGIWQFIPVCRTPCISVFKNFTEERLKFIKEEEDQIKKLKFLKGIHAPVFWRDSLVPPFRFNPKIKPEEQGKPFFVSIKTKLNLERGTFNFTSLLAPPQEKPPKFMKVKKEKKQQGKRDYKPNKPVEAKSNIEPPKKKVKIG